MLGAAADLGLDVRARQLLAQARDHLVDVKFTVAALFVKQAGNAPVGVGFEDAQCQILEFPLELPCAEPVRERREDVEREPRRIAAQLRIAALDREAQALGVIGELDQHHAHVLRHRQQHLAQAFELRRLLAGARRAAAQAFDHRHARHAFGKLGDARAELVAHREHRFRRYNHMSEQAGRQALGIELELAQYQCRVERVRQQRLAAMQRALGGLRRNPFEHALEQRNIRLGVISAQRGQPAGDAVLTGLGHELQMGCA